MMRRWVIIAIGVMGMSGIIAQTLLLRELLIIFSGNELTIGVILANWLLLEAAGSYGFGRLAGRMARRAEAFVLVQAIFSLFLPVSVYLARSLGGVAPGEGLGLVSVIVYSFLVLLPVALPHGALFALGCALVSHRDGESPSTHGGQAGVAGKVYIVETIGTAAGGVAFVYLLVPHAHSFEIALGLGVLNLIFCGILLASCERNRIRVALVAVCLVLVTASTAMLLRGGAGQLHRLSIARQFPHQNVVDYRNSVYGNIAVIRQEGQYTFFSDGIPVITTPVPEITFVEEFAHLPMLLVERPRRILILSGGAGGVIHEVLKHPSVEAIDYAELDPLLLEVIRQFPTPLTEQELSSPQVHVRNTDGRRFLQQTSTRYDVVLVGISGPSDLQVNRVFTKEFFHIVRERLASGGLLAFTLPGSEAYLGFELRDLNSSIYNTLRNSFPHVRAIRGDFNLYLASDSDGLESADAAKLVRRLEERDLPVNLLTSGYIDYKLDERKREWLLGSLDPRAEENSDFVPVAVFHWLAHRNRLFSPSLQWWFDGVQRMGMGLIAVFLALFTLLAAWGCRRCPGGMRIAVTLAIGCTGFTGMAFGLILVFGFQVFCGHVFHQIGVLVTAIMVGTVAGALLAVHRLGRARDVRALFLRAEAVILLFAGMLPLVFTALHPHFAEPGAFLAMHAGFITLCLVAGCLIGVQFPLATALVADSGSGPGATAGRLYAADLLGGCLGGILGGAALLPILGLSRTCIVLVMVKLSSLIILLVARREGTGL